MTKTIRDFNLAYGVKLTAMLATIGSVGFYVSQRYTIGIDTQDFRCLDEMVFIIDRWERPAATEIERNDYVAVTLTSAQTPANAKFAPGHVMVKRAVATDAGDEVEISRDGIHFSNGEEIWSHGTALEAAPMLGRKIEDFERTEVLGPGELFIMGDKINSYDGRYYGPVTEAQIVGTVVWAW